MRILLVGPLCVIVTILSGCKTSTPEVVEREEGDADQKNNQEQSSDDAPDEPELNDQTALEGSKNYLHKYLNLMKSSDKPVPPSSMKELTERYQARLNHLGSAKFVAAHMDTILAFWSDPTNYKLGDANKHFIAWKGFSDAEKKKFAVATLQRAYFIGVKNPQ